jgi:hypothetical protein
MYNHPLNCSQYPPLYVQSNDCRQGIHFRNISFRGNDLWIEGSKELEQVSYEKTENTVYQNIYLKIFERIFLNRYKTVFEQ